MHGFELLRELEIPELQTLAKVYRHEKTGARLLSMVNDDENKVFGISFRTPPEDSTGLPHILEHSVLCGSRKYPVKEPFVELLKGSLQTFLNALTFPDKTCYPVASTNERDFRNLVDVYLDAVFFPALTPDTLKQEGWHYDIEDPAEPLRYKGVVFNEMKGAYSSPDGLLSEYSQQSLFPDTTYGLDSGGDPERIPDLTWEQFSRFHAERYHPSNSYAYFYGDDDPDERLRVLDEYFSQFEAAEPDTEVPLQPRFTAPTVVERAYAASGKDSGAMVTVNFLLPETADPDLNLAFGVLEHVLIGMPSSPLRKALVDSGLGEDLAGVGLEADLRELYFSVGLKGVEAQDAPEVERVVLDTLRTLVEDGISAGDLEAALNTVEFDLRENNTGSYPRGLSTMFQALSSWLYDGDPLALLPFEDALAKLREKTSGAGRHLEDLLREHLLDNPHRTRVLLRPDPKLGEKREAKERARLDAAKSAMTAEELERTVAETLRLTEQQEAPDAPEDLARIPRLSLADLAPEETPIPSELLTDGHAPILFHDLHTSGILYLDLGFDLGVVPDRLLSYVPVFGRALLETGTRKRDFVELSQRIARKTGGIDPDTFTTNVYGCRDDASRFFLRGKSTVAQAPELLDILREVLMEADLGNVERLRRIIMESKARMEQRLVPSGHMLVLSRLRARTGKAGIVEERMNGVEALQRIRELAERVEKAPESVVLDFEELRSLLVSRSGLITNVTVDRESFEKVRPAVEYLFNELPDQENIRADRDPLALPHREGLAIPAQVNYVGCGSMAVGQGYEFDGSALVAVKLLRTAYLWDRVRVRGGAYGCFAVLDRVGGSLHFVSYRDPNVDRTLDIYGETAAYLQKLELSKDEMEKAVIGTIGQIDAYQLPDAKGFTALARYLSDETAPTRQAIRDKVLAAGVEDIRRFAAGVRAAVEDGDVVVLGSREAMRASSRQLALADLL